MEDVRSFNDRVNAIRDLPYGETRLALSQTLVRLADSAGTERERVLARDELIRSATFVGKPDVAMVAFVFNLGLDPQFEGRQDECWNQFRWVMISTPICGSIPEAEVDRVLQEMEKMWDYFGFYGYPLPQARMNWAHVVGRPPDEMLEHALEIDELLHYSTELYRMSIVFDAWRYVQDYDRCIEVHDRMLATGKHDLELPHMSICEAAPMFAHLQQFDKARTAVETGYEKCSDNPLFLEVMAPLIFATCMLEDFDRGVEIANAHYKWTESNVTTRYNLQFFTAGICALSNTNASPETVRSYWDDLVPLVKQFDTRHQNQTHSNWVKEMCARFSVAVDSRL